MIRKILPLILAIALTPASVEAKGYSSGGRSYSSGRSTSFSSRSFSSGSRSFSSGKSYSSGSGRTYSSGSASSRSSNTGTTRTYSSGSSGARSFVTPKTPSTSDSSSRGANKSVNSGSSASSLSFDNTAARAQKESASKRDFTAFKNGQSGSSRFDSSPPVIPRTGDGGRSYSGSYRSRPVYTPDPQSYATRTVRIEHYYAPYFGRPMVIYNDHYSSFFWWWLLDRSLNERAMWAYHHHSDMDDARYRTLLATDTNLEARVKQLETQNAPVNPSYTPTGLDRDLMYSDQYVHRAYVTRPTRAGRFLFWLIMVPTTTGCVWFMAWLVFYKRWQTA